MGRTISVNWIDWITLAIILVAVLRGTRYGVLAGAIDLGAIIGAFFVASALYAHVASGLHQALSVPTDWGGFVAFTVIWLGLYILVGSLVRLMHGVKTSPYSEALGGAIGVLRGIALATVLLVILLVSPFRQSVEPDAKRSLVAQLLISEYTDVMKILVPVIPVRTPRPGPDGTPF